MKMSKCILSRSLPVRRAYDKMHFQCDACRWRWKSVNNAIKSKCFFRKKKKKKNSNESTTINTYYLMCIVSSFANSERYCINIDWPVYATHYLLEIWTRWQYYSGLRQTWTITIFNEHNSSILHNKIDWFISVCSNEQNVNCCFTLFFYFVSCWRKSKNPSEYIQQSIIVQ